MLTEKVLRHNPELLKALTGVPAPAFWELVAKVETCLPDYERQRRERPDRRRAVGAGRPYDQPLATRMAVVLAYMRLHIPQAVVAMLFGVTQTDVSRELRRIPPMLRLVLPVPEVWELVGEGEALPAEAVIASSEVADGRVLVDATEQEIERPKDSQERKEYYSGKHKEFTVKTQFVTDGEHHILAISEAVPGTKHDKKLSDETATVQRVPEGCEVDADKGYQGMAQQVELVIVRNAETGEEQQVPRVTVKTPYKKLKGGP